MVTSSVVLDTNIVIELFKENITVKKKLDEFDIWYLSSTVAGELIFGVINSPNPDKHLKKYQDFVRKCKALIIDFDVAEKYAEIRLELKKKGKPIPENDIWIAAVCVANKLPLMTNDSHFQNIDKLKTIIPTE